MGDNGRWDEFFASPVTDWAYGSDSWVAEHLHLLGTPGDMPALDAGCGAGRHTRLLLDAGWQVVAVDQSSQAIAALESRMRRDDRLSYHAMNLEDIAARNAFAGGVCSDVLSVAADPDACLKAIRAASISGATFIFTVQTPDDETRDDGRVVSRARGVTTTVDGSYRFSFYEPDAFIELLAAFGWAPLKSSCYLRVDPPHANRGHVHSHSLFGVVAVAT